MGTEGERRGGGVFLSGKSGKGFPAATSLELGGLKTGCHVKAELGTPETIERVQPDRAGGSKEEQEALLTIRRREAFMRRQGCQWVGRSD